MRINEPVTQREYESGDKVILMSTIDPQSYLRYANAAFVEVSGFDMEEIKEQPHNLVRPLMPREAKLRGGEGRQPGKLEPEKSGFQPLRASSASLSLLTPITSIPAIA